jgi:hypothetical protein
MLLQDHFSPVGFRVPNFPDFTIDPNQAKRGLSCVSADHEMYCAVVMAILTMGLMVSMSFTDWTKTLEDKIAAKLQDMFH